MKFFLILLILGLIGAGLYFSGVLKPGSMGKSSNVTLTESGASVDLADVKVDFSVTEEFSGDYMLFGGSYLSHKNAVVPTVLSGLHMDDVKDIYKDYPDFHKCASPGASLAKPLVLSLDFIPMDSSVLKELKDAINTFHANIKNDGDRVCVSISGNYLQLKKATIKANSADVTSKYGNLNFRLVDSAEMIDCKNFLETI